MTDKIVKVTRNADTLDVADAGALKFDVAKGVRTIFWTLSGNELDAWFWPEGHPGKPAFTWIDTPPDGVFPWPPKTIADGKKLVIDNKHFNLRSKVDWKYMLRAAREKPGKPGEYEYATTTYTAPATTSIRTSNNPVIINKGP